MSNNAAHTGLDASGTGGQSQPVERQRLEEIEADPIQVPSLTAIERTATIGDLGIDYNDIVGADLLRDAASVELPDDIAEIVTDDGVLGDRELFTWKWIYYIFGDLLTLPSVPEHHVQAAQETKFLIGTYITLMDDLAEKHGDNETFWELAKVVYPNATPDWDDDGIRSNYADSVRRVWRALEERFDDAPRYSTFRNAFQFDLRSSLQAMDFARLSGDHAGFANRVETWQYETEAIGMYATVGTDVMFSPSFDPDDYGAFRELINELQRMWRLGNWVITWKREVHEHDFSAGVIVEALHQDVITETHLDRLTEGELEPDYVIDRIAASGIPKQFICDWKRRRDKLREREFDVDSFDPDAMITHMEQLMRSHLATEGHR